MNDLLIFGFFSPGPFEIAIIGCIAVLLFGSRLPKLARSVGSSIVEFKRGIKEIDELESDLDIKKDINNA